MFSRLFLRNSRALVLSSIGLGLSIPQPHSQPIQHQFGQNFIADAVEKVIDSVVNISVEIESQKFFKKPLVSSGSGFFIHPGFILTNAHVVSEMMDSTEVMVTTSDGIKLQGFVYALDMLADIALVKIKKDSLKKYLDSSDQDESAFPWPVVQLDWVILSLPLEVHLDYKIQLPLGLFLVYKETSIRLPALLKEPVKMQGLVHSGSSGGPLVNISGQVVGINTSRAEMEGITFAIRLDSTILMIRQMLKQGHVSRPFLGINMVGLSKAVWNQLGERSMKSPPVPVHEGVLLTNVLGGSPAYKAGLEAFDVITHVNAKPVQSSHQILQAVGLGIGTPVILKITRNVPLEVDWDGSVRRWEAIVREVEVVPEELDVSMQQEIQQRPELGV